MGCYLKAVCGFHIIKDAVFLFNLRQRGSLGARPQTAEALTNGPTAPAMSVRDLDERFKWLQRK